jgi:fumarate reductase flavoprotein subunit
MAIDLIVIGSGGAGLVAAIAAADAGAKVLQLEKSTELGGAFLISQGTSTGTQTKIQFENGILDDSPQAFYRDCMQEARAREVCDPEGLMFYCRNSGFAVDWLDSLGAYPADRRNCEPTIYGEDWSYGRVYRVDWATSYLRVILAEHHLRVARGDIEVRLKTEVSELMTADGAVTGVIANGQQIRAGAVIVCTGGYCANPDMVRQHKLPGARTIVTAGSPLATGDGLEMCRRAGAQLVNLGQELLPYMGNVADPDNPILATAYVDMNHPAVIWVDLNGQRVIAEDSNIYTPPARIAMMGAPEMVLVTVFDAASRDSERPLLTRWLGTVEVRDWDWLDGQTATGGVVKRADTIAGLAAELGIDGPTLEATVNRWNEHVEAGVDADFGRQTLTHRIATPPYYAIETVPAILISAGGPATNVKQQVLNDTHRVIPGLYAAGEVTGYRAFGTGSLNTGNVVYGRQAGVMAAAHAMGR